ncbi:MULTISPECIES: OmpA family protein [unclassified Streptomyces]|uniref:OmpA family protein n=1 Tax=unclassified Streptomyces TaxID=2593676 RepID=UPI00381966CD
MPAPIPRHRRAVAVAVAVVLLFSGAQFSTAAGALADDGPSVPPGTEPTGRPPEIDGSSPGLRLRDGATLAPARVLPIVSIVETEGGEERREETNESLKFALQAEVLFGKDSAELSGAAQARIASVAAEITRQGSTQVRVFGFTDDLGSAAHGDVLSKKRADAVHQVLAQELDSSDIRYEIRGYGELFPIADNSSEEGRRKNRRVEISFPRGDGSGG